MKSDRPACEQLAMTKEDIPIDSAIESDNSRIAQKLSRPLRSRRNPHDLIVPSRLFLVFVLSQLFQPTWSFCELSYRVLDEFGEEVNAFRPGGTLAFTCRGAHAPTFVASFVSRNITREPDAVTYFYRIGFGYEFWQLMPKPNTRPEQMFCDCGPEGLSYLDPNWYPKYYLCEWDDCQKPCEGQNVCYITKNKKGEREPHCSLSQNCVPHSKTQLQNRYKVVCLGGGGGTEESECEAFGGVTWPMLEIMSRQSHLCPAFEISEEFSLGKTQVMNHPTNTIIPFKSCGLQTRLLQCELHTIESAWGIPLLGSCETGWTIQTKDLPSKGKIVCKGEGEVGINKERVHFRWFNYLVNGSNPLYFRPGRPRLGGLGAAE